METGEVVPKNPAIAIEILEKIVNQIGRAVHIIPRQTNKLSRFTIILLIN